VRIEVRIEVRAVGGEPEDAGWEDLGDGLIPRARRMGVKKLAGDDSDPEASLEGVAGGFRCPPRPSLNGPLLPGELDELSIVDTGF
jgi:hypothetical protein